MIKLSFCVLPHNVLIFLFLNLNDISAWSLHTNKRKNLLRSKILPLLSELCQISQNPLD